MTILFIILIIIASVVLGFIVLVQNPKGGGLAGNVAGFSNQFMGVKQTTDVLEKGTWIFAAVVAALSLCSVFFIPKTAGTSSSGTDVQKAALPSTNQTAPATNPTNTIQLGPNQNQPAPNK
jgi:preprotein translocase subunit SecG